MLPRVKRHFNTTGACRPEWHYMIPADRRLPEARPLVESGMYFVIHAPRQTGKSTVLESLARDLTASGKYAAVSFSCESGEVAGDDFVAAQQMILADIGMRARQQLPPELQPPSDLGPPESALEITLETWARTCPRPLVLFFDEIDALRGKTLIAVLRQLRSGFTARPASFPHSVVLCGLRDVRDYKAASGGDPSRLGTSSPFNIKVESLRLGDFTADEVRELYQQHTAETGQPFSEEALSRAFEVTQGQPWLVNALGREVVNKMQVPVSETVTEDHIDQAKERLILARQTHLDSLVDKLREDRVRRILEPILAGEAPLGDAYNDDVQYARDLGLLARTNPLRIANPIYREVILRVLTASAEGIVTDEPRAFVLPDGRLDFRRLLTEFAAFWREHGDVLPRAVAYDEVAAQLVFLAYMQRIVNGGGYIDREYGVGRGRIDACVRWPHRDPSGKRLWQREAVELKVWRKGKDPLEKGLVQLDGYLAGLGLQEGALVIFDQRPDIGDPESRTRFEEAATPSGRKVTVLRA